MCLAWPIMIVFLSLCVILNCTVAFFVKITPVDWTNISSNFYSVPICMDVHTVILLSSLGPWSPLLISGNWLVTFPCCCIARDENGHILGVVPLYLKRFDIINRISSPVFLLSHVICAPFILFIGWATTLWTCSHSRGEFVFDQSWAEAYYSCGLEYYPKLQSCVSFTPVTGQRIFTSKYIIIHTMIKFLMH